MHIGRPYHFRIDSAHKTGKPAPAGGTKRVLVLGAGYVSGPVIEYLCQSDDCDVTVATAVHEDVERLMRLSPRVRPEILDVRKDVDKLEALVDDSDIALR